MGGAVRAVVGPKREQTVQAVKEQNPPAQMSAPGVTQATQQQEKEGSRMRGARRRGRQLLSDVRLTGADGVETLGGVSNL